MRPLTFALLRGANLERCETSFHGLCEWSPTDWATAFAGEAGETCNEVKKLRRLYPEGWHVFDSEDRTSLTSGVRGTIAADVVNKLAHELADTIIYADLLAARLGIDLGAAVAQKFNIVSDRVGSDVKLEV